jgi:beta-lactamase regulating signal transducer with metallopeptidase domain
MENFLLYFAKVNGLIILFYLLYLVLLRKETFYVSNRWYLLMGLVTAIILPLITFTKTVWVNPEPISKFIEAVPITNDKTIRTVSEPPIDWSLILSAAYGLIIFLILLKVGIEIASFFYKTIRLNKQKETNYTLIYANSTENPFSFFKYIVINPTLFSKVEFEHILTHERIHAKQWHSIDVLFSKVFCAFFWINPISWLYRKAMLQNLEFIADNQSLEQIESKYEYQKTLLKVVVHQQIVGITNPFYQSLIKKRIIMLHTNQSHKRNSWKYAAILPVLVGFMLLFQIETIAQVKESKIDKSKIEETKSESSSSFSSILTKNSTDEDLSELQKIFSVNKYKLKISNVKRNKKGEIIEIKLSFDSGKTYNQILERKSTEPIDNIKIFINTDKDNNKTCGFEEINDTVAVEAVEVEKDTTNYTIDNLVKNGKKVNLIVNGKLQTATIKSKIPLDQEIDKFEELDEKQLKSKYNIDKKEGETYYEITTKKESEKPNSEAAYAVLVEAEFSEDGNLSHMDKIKGDKLVDAKKALILFNGKEINYEDLDKIDPKTISSFGNSIASHAMKKYGEKGKNGVISINTKAYDLEKYPFMKEYENKKQIELKAQENSSNSKEVIEERKKKLEERKIKLEQIKEERKKKIEQKKE